MGSTTPPTGRPRSTRPWAALVIAALGVMMSDLNMTLVAVASPVVERELDTGLSAIQWVSNGYLLALAVALIPAGRFGDYYGHRRMFLIGVAGFGLSSIAIGLGGHVIVIIIVRVGQGVCAALVIPAALGLLRSAFPPERFSTAIGVYGMVIGASTAAGPMAGGLLVEQFGCQAVRRHRRARLHHRRQGQQRTATTMGCGRPAAAVTRSTAAGERCRRGREPASTVRRFANGRRERRSPLS